MIKFGLIFFSFFLSSNYKLLINTCSRYLPCPHHLLICFRKVCHPIRAINKPSPITGQFSPTDPPLLIGQSVDLFYAARCREVTWVGYLASPPSSVTAMRVIRLNPFYSLRDNTGQEDKIGNLSTKKKTANSLMTKSHQPTEEKFERLRVLGTQGVRGLQGADSDNYVEVFDSILLSDSSFSTSFSSSSFSSSCPCCPPPLPPRQLCPQAPPRPPYPSTWIFKKNVFC